MVGLVLGKDYQEDLDMIMNYQKHLGQLLVRNNSCTLTSLLTLEEIFTLLHRKDGGVINIMVLEYSLFILRREVLEQEDQQQAMSRDYVVMLLEETELKMINLGDYAGHLFSLQQQFGMSNFQLFQNIIVDYLFSQTPMLRSKMYL